MLPERVDLMLKNYRQYHGRCLYLEELIKNLEKEIERARYRMVEDNVSISGQAMDGMPHGTSPGNPTERIGLMLASVSETDYQRQLEKELREARNEYDEKIPTVVFVEAWFTGLTAREKWIVENQVIDSMCWRDVTASYLLTFSESRTKRSLQMLRDKAMGKIYEMAA